MARAREVRVRWQKHNSWQKLPPCKSTWADYECHLGPVFRYL